LQHYICTYDPSVFYYGATLAETDALGNTQVADTYDRSLNTDNFVAGFGIAKYNSAGITGKYDTKLTDYFSKDDSALHTLFKNVIGGSRTIYECGHSDSPITDIACDENFTEENTQVEVVVGERAIPDEGA